MNFEDLVRRVLMRFYAQNGRPVPPHEVLTALAERLLAVIRERGLPPPLAQHDAGTPGGISEAELSPLVTRVLGEISDELLPDAVRQLLKACLYPEFSPCRESYREVSRDGSCRRQELPRARLRISGTHCVDCPYWLTEDREPHATLLRQAWRTGSPAFESHIDIFLPEDFRALRRWVRAAAQR